MAREFTKNARRIAIPCSCYTLHTMIDRFTASLPLSPFTRSQTRTGLVQVQYEAVLTLEYSLSLPASSSFWFSLACPRPTTHDLACCPGFCFCLFAPLVLCLRCLHRAAPSVCWCCLAFTRYCFTSRLYCTIIFFANTPFLLCNILHNITSYCTPPPDFEVFFRCLEVFGGVFLLALVVGFWMGGGV